MSDSQSNSEIIAGLAEEFVERYRQGERPPVSEYTAQYPELAEEIREFFAAVAMVENLAPAESESFGDAGSDASSAALPALKRLGDFRIIREVGRGGMGVVYEAEQVSLGRHVALKVLPGSALPDDKHIKRFEREAKSAAKLHHTNIVPVFGVGTEDDLHYYVMQFIQGLPLDEVIEELKQVRAQPTGTITAPVRTGAGGDSSRRRSVADVARSLMTGQFAQTQIGESDSDADGVEPAGEHPNLVQTATELSPQAGDTSTPRLSDTFNLSGSISGSGVRLGQSGSQSSQKKSFTYWESVANIGLQVADAMQYAHDQGILHRDIKPSNLLLDMKGTAWVTDFGLAKATDQQDITHTGDILGTLRYMPPEAFEGIADARSDVYSLGLTLYELLCFQPAFGMKDRNRLVKQVTTEAAPRLEKLNPEIPRDLVTIIHKAIDRDPSHRYQNARALQEDLQRFIDDEPIRARRISTTERLARWSRRNKGLAASLAAVAVLLLVINIAGPVMTWRLQEEKEKLLSSESSLLAAVTELEAREQDLEETGRRLEAQTHRASDEAAAARSLARENGQIADEKTKLAAETERQRLLARRALYSSALFAAQHAISNPEGSARVQDMLDEVRPQAGDDDLRGWEWYYLHAQLLSDSVVLQSFSRHPASVAFSPDGQLLATSEGSGEVKLFDANSGHLRQTLVGHQENVSWVAWNPDGTRLASSGADKTARIWNVETGAEELQLLGHTAWVAVVAWSPDGHRLVTGGLDGAIRTWDATSGDNVLTIHESSSAIRGVDWSPDGSRLVSGDDEQAVRIWDSETGDSIHALLGHGGLISRVRFSPDGRRVASVSHVTAKNAVIIWDAELGTELATVDYRTSGAHDVKWSPDGSRLATAGFDNETVDIWDSDTGELLHSLSGHRAKVLGCSWSPDGLRLASAGGDHTVRVWNVADEQPMIGDAFPVFSLAWNPDGSRIATASLEHGVKIWDVRTRQELLTFSGVHKRIFDVDWDPDGARLASCGAGQVFHVWEAETGQVLHTINATNDGDIRNVVWSPDGTQVASAGDDGSVRVFDAETGDEVQRFNLNESAYRLDWNGERLAAVGYHGQLAVWNVETGDEVARFLKRDQAFVALRFSPDGSRLAVGGNSKPQESIFDDSSTGAEGTVIVWDLETGQEQHRLLGHTDVVRSLDWSDHGARLLSAGLDGRLILWDAATGAQLLVIRDSENQPTISAQFSPDELQIAAGGMAPGIRLWDATAGYSAELSPKMLTGLDAKIEREPTVDSLMLRGRIYSAEREWDRAAADFQQATRLRPPRDDTPAWIETSWWVAGPDPLPLDEQQPPETHLEPLEPIPSVDDSDWQPAHLSSRQGLNLGRIFAGAEQISAYAMTRVFAPEQQTAGLLLGADDQVRVWLNGTVIPVDEVSSEAIPDDDGVEITLQPGWNTLLFKVNNNRQAHGLFARLSRDPIDLGRVFSRNEKWTEAFASWNRAYAEHPDDLEVLLGRGRAALGVGDLEVAEQSFKTALVKNEPNVVRTVAAAHAEHARSLIDAGRPTQAVDSLARSRALYEELLSGDGARDADVAALTDVVLAETSEWTVLKPDEMSGEAGETLSVQTDNSIFVSGPNPDRAIYTLKIPLDQPLITAVRLETLPDPRLPQGAAGRFPESGNFHVSQLSVSLLSRNAPEPIPLPIVAAIEERAPTWPTTVAWAIDGRPTTRWDPTPSIPRSAVFLFESPVETADGLLIVTLDSGITEWGQHGLGRFRLSVTDDPNALEAEDRRLTNAGIPDPWVRLGAAYALLGDAGPFVELFARALERTPEFDTRRKLVRGIEELPIDLGDLLVLRPDDPLLWSALAKRQSAEDQADAAAWSFSQARSVAEALLTESPADEPLAGFLADLLLTDTTEWSVVEPSEMTSAGGATLEWQNDGSIFVSGKNPDEDLYTVALPLDSANVCALRLETLTDKRLPGGRSGRSDINGNFHLAEISLSLRSARDPSFERQIPVKRASADVVGSNGRVIEYAIDSDRETLWTPHPLQMQDHEAVFEFQLPAAVGLQGLRLVVQLDTGLSEWPQHGLGRFRLSLTDDPAAVESNDRRFTILRNQNPWVRLGATYAALSESIQAAKWFARALERAPDFAARRALVERIDEMQTDLSDLLALRPDDPLLLGALAKRQAAAGEMEAAAESLARARRLTEALLGHTTEWTVLEPMIAESAEGATLTRQPDNSVVASGPNVDGDVYAIQAEVELPEVRAIRLEALPDPSLPNQGPGRHGTGNFQLSAFRVFVVSDAEPETAERLEIADARASFEFNQYGNGGVVGTIHDDDPRMWHVFGRPGDQHVAVFQLAAPRRVEPGQSLVVQCVHRARGSGEGINLGRFRLSVSADPQALESVRPPGSPEDDSLPGFLAELLLTDTTRWTVLEPSVVASDGDSTLTTLDDHSVLAGGPNPDHDRYTVTTEPIDLQNIMAIRLEALTDGSLPNQGPGRSWGGRFVMDRFKVTGSSAATPDSPAEIDLAAACADFVRPDRPIRPGGEWHAAARGEGGRSHVAVYRLAEPLLSQMGTQLRFEMTFNHGPDWPRLHLGRFRLSVTDDPAAFETNDRRFAISRIEDPWARLYAAYAALGESTQAAAWFARALERAPDFAARREFVEQIDNSEMDLDALVALHPDDPLLWNALAERQSAAGQTEAAAESFARTRSLTEALLAESPDDEALAGFLADLLLTDTTRWTVLEPSVAASEGDSTLTTLEDHSILAGGPNPDHDRYTVTTEPIDLQNITAIRLEALTDDSLPSRGPGRLERGRFDMTRIRVAAASRENPEAPVDLNLDAVSADYFHRHFLTPNGRWLVAVGSGAGRPCTAIYRVLGELVEPLEGSSLKFEMTFSPGADFPGRNLGRFRLSVTDDPTAFETNDRRHTISRIEDPWERLAANYYLTADEPALSALLHRKPQTAMGIVNVADWSEAIVWLDRALNAVPANAEERSHLLRLRAAVHVRAGQWDRAAADYAGSVELDPAADSLAWMKPAALWAYAGDAEQLREWSRKMAERFRANAVAADADRTLKVMLLLEDALDPELAPIERFLAALDRNEQPNLRVWFLSTRGLLACRSGEFDEALRDVDQSLTLAAGASPGSTHVLIALGVQALIHAKQGSMTAAQAAVDELKTQLATRLSWREDGTLEGGTIVNAERIEHDLLIPEILRREAERLIQDAAAPREQQTDAAEPQP